MGCSSGKAYDWEVPSDDPRDNPKRVSQLWGKDQMEYGLLNMADTLRAAKEGKLQSEAMPLPPPPDSGFLARVTAWEFDLFSVKYAELPKYAYWTLITHPAIAGSKLDRMKLWRYVCELAEWYHPRPFHNFRHAVDVLLATAGLIGLIEKENPRPFQKTSEVAALLISALVHDTDHPGVMNTYLIAVKHPLAVALDPPVAVLENHHASVAMALCDRPELDFLHTLPAAERKVFVDRIRVNVLYTDVTTTMPTAKEFQKSGRRMSASVVAFNESVSLRESRKSSGVGLDAEDDDLDTSLLFSMIIKAADISNPTRSLTIYDKWIEGIMAEFSAQGDAERDKGLTISMNCDRYTVLASKAQVGFITFLVGPLFASLVGFAPSLSFLSEQLEKNKEHFAKLAETTPPPQEIPTTQATPPTQQAL